MEARRDQKLKIGNIKWKLHGDAESDIENFIVICFLSSPISAAVLHDSEQHLCFPGCISYHRAVGIFLLLAVNVIWWHFQHVPPLCHCLWSLMLHQSHLAWVQQWLMTWSVDGVGRWHKGCVSYRWELQVFMFSLNSASTKIQGTWRFYQWGTTWYEVTFSTL